MSKKASIIAVTILIMIAIILGFMLVSHGDGPISGIIISNKEITDMSNYKAAQDSHGGGIYLVIENQFNNYKQKYKSQIKGDSNIYANLHLVECPKGTEINVKWLKSGNIVNEDVKELSSDREGIISYLLDGDEVKKGNYTFEAYFDGKRIIKQDFTVE